jgi:hypothetical protein
MKLFLFVLVQVYGSALGARVKVTQPSRRMLMLLYLERYLLLRLLDFFHRLRLLLALGIAFVF